MSGEPAYDDAKFEEALQMVLDKNKHDYSAMIGGTHIASGVDMPLVSPVDNTIIFGTLQEPEKGTATVAAETAKKVFETWSKSSQEERGRILSFVVNAMGTRRYSLAAEIVLSTGMTRKEAIAEVDRFVEVLKQAAEDAVTIKGKPKGVWGIIALASSPLASPMGYAAAAIAAGSTVVIMPSGNCPQPVFTVYDLFVKAGMPNGVINIVSDRLDRYVTELSDNMNITGIVASGCGRGMDDLMFLMVDDGLDFINEIKGMNPIVIAHPSDIKKAAADVLDSAFRYCGQHLYSTSKVIILADDERDFTRALVEQAKDLNINDPWESDTFCGPLMSEDAENRFDKLLTQEEAFLLHGGKRVKKEYTMNGRYYTPAIFTSMPAEDDTLYVDQALPILSIHTVATLDDIIADLDETDKGLAVGIMSRDNTVINLVKEAVGDDVQVFINKSSLTLKPAMKAEMRNFLK
ncbi:MAG: aldehyde dehydrogenase family protein [archaeon]|nr:aldehyde dehydrogenase family protein [archaeon]